MLFQILNISQFLVVLSRIKNLYRLQSTDLVIEIESR